jgi:hypothetical protein
MVISSVSNFPALNTFKTNQTSQTEQAQRSAQEAEDLVEISSAAVQKLEEAEQQRASSEIEQVASEARSFLEQNDASLSSGRDLPE